ncbi:hypothetical protein B0H11DRAFT_1898176 [Mycena galericulata]|nr:hypothetical protein B0H11DRAFT_1898176 [Mycena galericulata]
MAHRDDDSLIRRPIIQLRTSPMDFINNKTLQGRGVIIRTPQCIGMMSGSLGEASFKYGNPRRISPRKSWAATSFEMTSTNTRIDYQDNGMHRDDGSLIGGTTIHFRRSTMDFAKEISAAGIGIEESAIERHLQRTSGNRWPANHRTSQRNFGLGRLDREYQENRCVAFTNIGHRELRQIGHRNFDIGGPDREYQENCWPAFRNLGISDIGLGKARRKEIFPNKIGAAPRLLSRRRRPGICAPGTWSKIDNENHHQEAGAED